MKAGQLNRRVTVQSVAEAPDADGQMIPTATDLGTYWAAIRTPNTREAIIAQQNKATLTHVITMRYHGTAPLKPNYQVAYKGRTFQIIGPPIDVDERHRQIDLHCTEVVPTDEPAFPPAGGG